MCTGMSKGSYRLEIVQILPRTTAHTGGSIQAILLAKSLLEKNHFVTMITRGGECEEEAMRLSIPHTTNAMKITSPESIINFIKTIARFKNPIMHAHKGDGITFSILTKLILGRGKVVVNRGVFFPLTITNRWKYRVNLVDAVITVCENLKKDLAIRDKINPEKIKVVYGSIGDKFFRKVEVEEIRKELSINSKDFTLSLIGEFRVEKGHKVLLKAKKSLDKKLKNINLLFVGKKNEKKLNELKAIYDRFTAIGHRKDVERFMKISDVVINASYGEGLPGVVREAMAVGTPVVASRVGGTEEIVIHGKTGLLFEKGDSKQLEELIVTLFKYPVIRKKLSINGMKKANNYTNEKRIQRIIKVYEDIL